MRRKSPILAGLAIFFSGAMAVQALINPNFTPVNLAQDADLILVLKAGAVGADKKCKAEIKECLKPVEKDKAVSGSQVLDLQYARKEQIETIKTMLTSQGDKPILLFSGKGQNQEDVGYLHLGGKWLELERSKEANTWDVLSMDARSGSQGMGMEATWAGGTDGLLALMKLLIKFPEMAVPVEGGSQWEEPLMVAKLEGKVNRMQAVDLAGKGVFSLFVAADAGDKVYTWNAESKKFDDVTGKIKLASKSKIVAWGDFDADGRLDLASFDGKALGLWLQGADGSFAMTAVTGAPEGGCISLQALDVGVKGRAGLVWATATGVTVLVPDAAKAGTFTAKPLAGVLAGQGVESLVADLDGDALADVILVGLQGSIIWKGKGAADFADGKASPVKTGPGLPATAWVGDWDMNGKLDVFTISEEACRLWQNEGDMQFLDLIYISGELAYISKGGGVAGNVSDINNDGRQDVFLAYTGMGPQTFFNRIFRSFGHAHRPLDLTELNTLPQALEGQQAGVMADITDDGAQDMAITAKNGELYVFQRSVEVGSCLVARIALPVGSSYCGPVTVSGDNGMYKTGAWAVMPGVSEAFIGRADAGELTVTWQLPGGAPQSRKFVLEDKPVRFVIPVGK